MRIPILDANFSSLSGARIVRVATHPNCQRQGYGTRALQLLQMYYEGEMGEDADGEEERALEAEVVDEDDVTLLEESLLPRSNLPPLLSKLNERKAERLDYLGVSFGLTQDLLKFWKTKCHFLPTYLSQKANALTGEHSCIMLKVLRASELPESATAWLPAFSTDFRKRMIHLLSCEAFRKFPSALALELATGEKSWRQQQSQILPQLTTSDIDHEISAYDLNRLDMYCKRQAEYPLVMDLVDSLAKLYYSRAFGEKGTHVSGIQQCALAGLGLQKKSVEKVAEEIGLDHKQLLGQFRELIKKLTSVLRSAKEKEIEASLHLNDGRQVLTFKAPLQSLDKELDDAAEEDAKKRKIKALEQYKIKGSEGEWKKALSNKGGKQLISVKSGEKRTLEEDNGERDGAKKKKKKNKVKS